MMLRKGRCFQSNVLQFVQSIDWPSVYPDRGEDEEIGYDQRLEGGQGGDPMSDAQGDTAPEGEPLLEEKQEEPQVPAPVLKLFFSYEGRTKKAIGAVPTFAALEALFLDKFPNASSKG